MGGEESLSVLQNINNIIGVGVRALQDPGNPLGSPGPRILIHNRTQPIHGNQSIRQGFHIKLVKFVFFSTEKFLDGRFSHRWIVFFKRVLWDYFQIFIILWFYTVSFQWILSTDPSISRLLLLRTVMIPGYILVTLWFRYNMFRSFPVYRFTILFIKSNPELDVFRMKFRTPGLRFNGRFFLVILRVGFISALRTL